MTVPTTKKKAYFKVDFCVLHVEQLVRCVDVVKRKTKQV